MANLLNQAFNKGLGTASSAIRDTTGIDPSQSLGKQFRNFGRQLITADNVRDPQHGARLFVNNNFELIPKQSGLFHVYVEFVNPTLISDVRKTELGMLAKAVTLPTFSYDTQTLNAYNRKINVQKRVNYDPVTITFHDDNANVVQEFCRKYFAHYYRDGDHTTAMYNNQNIYGLRNTDAWGYNPQRNLPARSDAAERQGNFISRIRIYSLQNKKATEYILINPMITRWRNGNHTAGSNEFMDNEVTISYEAVKYNENILFNPVTPDTVSGFGNRHYDTTRSPLATLGSTRSIFGPGGAIQSAEGIGADIASGNFIGAAATAARSFNTFKNANLKEVLASDTQGLLRDSARDGISNTLGSGRYRFPSIPGVSSGGNRSGATSEIAPASEASIMGRRP